MSVDLDRQLREYCREMDETQGVLSVDDILERSGELQVVPGRPLPDRNASTRRNWVTAAAVALAVVVVAIGIRLLTTIGGESEPIDQPTPTSVPGVWPGAVHERDALVNPMTAEPDGLLTWQDPHDAAEGWVDVERVAFINEGQPHWYIELAAKPPLPADREPGMLIAYGFVLDTDADGVADYLIGIDNDTPEPGDFHVWFTDLATGETKEQIGPPYGFPIEFKHPDEDRPGDNPPGFPPTLFFTFLTGSRPWAGMGLDPETARFYAWTSATRDGEVYAWDYAPDAGWITAEGSSEPSASTLQDLRLPGMSPNEPAGEYGWTSGSGIGWMHRVVTDGSESRETQLAFAVGNNCFAAGGDPVSVTVAGLGGKYVEPYGGSSMFVHRPTSGEPTAAYALPIGDRTLCVYLTWDAATTPEELRAAREVVESIRGEPHGEDGIRINFTLPAGWDTG